MELQQRQLRQIQLQQLQSQQQWLLQLQLLKQIKILSLGLQLFQITEDLQ
jgi:hypothetical protein